MKTVIQTRALDYCLKCKMTVVAVLKDSAGGSPVRFCPVCYDPLGMSGAEAERARADIREAMARR